MQELRSADWKLAQALMAVNAKEKKPVAEQDYNTIKHSPPASYQARKTEVREFPCLGRITTLDGEGMNPQG